MNDSESPVPQMEWQKFLETCPPGQRRELTEFVDYQHPSVCEFKAPVLGLFCDSEVCNKICFFDGSSGTSQLSYESLKPVYFTYRCRHCKHSLKFFSVMFETTEGNDLKVYGEKMGEWPAYGPLTPAKVSALIGPDREFFFKGRRAESQGMGIGAFGYYRRVVERQKNRIIDEIIRVCEKISADPSIIAELRAAKEETQFTSAIDKIKPGIPDALKINGHNPLTLLHSALSEGIHSDSDEECLELAISIRHVLTDLAERMNSALANNDELENAVNRLLKKNAAKSPKA